MAGTGDVRSVRADRGFRHGAPAVRPAQGLRRGDHHEGPLTAAALVTVDVAQVPKLGDRPGDIAVAVAVPLHALFLVVMTHGGMAIARSFRLDTGGGRAVVFAERDGSGSLSA